MSKIIKRKVAKKDVPAFEKMLGFKTTGDIEVHTWDKKTEKKIDKLMEELYLPNLSPQGNNKGGKGQKPSTGERLGCTRLGADMSVTNPPSGINSTKGNHICSECLTILDNISVHDHVLIHKELFNEG